MDQRSLSNRLRRRERCSSIPYQARSPFAGSVMRAGPCLRVESAVLRPSTLSGLLGMRQRLATLGQPTSIRPSSKADHARPRRAGSEVSWFLWDFPEADQPSNLAGNLLLASRDTGRT